MTEKIYLGTLKSVLGCSVFHYYFVVQHPLLGLMTEGSIDTSEILTAIPKF